MTTEQMTLCRWIIASTVPVLFAACASEGATRETPVRQSAPLPNAAEADGYTEPYCGDPQVSSPFCDPNADAGYIYFGVPDMDTTDRVASFLEEADATWRFSLYYKTSDGESEELGLAQAAVPRGEISVEIITDEFGTYGYVPISRFCDLPNDATIAPTSLGVLVELADGQKEPLIIVERFDPNNAYAVKTVNAGTQCALSGPTLSTTPSPGNTLWPVCEYDVGTGWVVQSCEAPTHIHFRTDDPSFRQLVQAAYDSAAAGDQSAEARGSASLRVRLCASSGCGTSPDVEISPRDMQLDNGGAFTFWWRPLTDLLPIDFNEPGDVLPQGDGVLIDSGSLSAERSGERIDVAFTGHPQPFLLPSN